MLSFAFAMYILAQKESLAKQCRRVITAMFKQERADKITRVLGMVNKSFSSFISGQCTEAVIIGILCFIGMLIFRFPYASVISVMVGFTALIPLVGAFIGTGIGAFLILMVDPAKSFWFIVFIIVLQQLEDNLVYPKIVGKSLGLPSIFVLAAITIGGEIGGVAGMLIGVPVFSVLYQLGNEYIEKRLAARRKIQP